MSDLSRAIEVGRQSHSCPWLTTARHVEQFDYYHPTNGILVKPCCSLRPRDPKHFELGTQESNIQRMIGQFEQGQWPDECSVCRGEERDSMISERLRGFETFIDRPEALETVIHLHIKFSNLCNLACRVCNSTESTTYGRKIEERDPDIFTQQDITLHQDWPLLLDYIEQIISRNPAVRICLIGGETTLAPGLEVFAAWLTERNYIQNIKLAFTSNMLNMPDHVLELGKNSQEMVISASLDSTNENFHYVRWPGTWNKATATVDKILAYRRTHGARIMLQVCPNFNTNNVFYFDDFLDYWSDHEYDSMMVFNLYAPSVFRIDTLPAYIRPHLIERLSRCQQHRFFSSQKDSDLVLSWLTTTIERLQDFTNINDELWMRYLRINAEFDHVTGTSIWDYNARLADLLTDEDAAFYRTAVDAAARHRLSKQPGLLFADNNPTWQKIRVFQP